MAGYVTCPLCDAIVIPDAIRLHCQGHEAETGTSFESQVAARTITEIEDHLRAEAP